MRRLPHALGIIPTAINIDNSSLLYSLLSHTPPLYTEGASRAVRAVRARGATVARLT